MAEAEGRPRTEPGDATGAVTLPAVFGRYLLLRRLSRGGMGEIFLAKLGEIQGFEKLVIIKKVLPNLTADAEFIRRFIDEAQVAIKLNHANIAPVFEVGRVDGEYFIAIAYIEGRDLRRTMARLRDEDRALTPDLALYVVRELAAGLAYAHRRTDDAGVPLHLVHCDISPPNVMLSFEGEVKIIDFGIARSVLRLAESNPNMGFGKFGYMAPEQLLRGGVIDKRTDLYAAGVVLYELLTGQRMVAQPSSGDYRAVARAVTQGKFPPPSVKKPGSPAALDALVMKAIAVKPEDRFQTGEALRDAIQVELARINPTLSADTLSAVLRGLFADEVTEERELLSRMQAVDLAPFREELTEASVSHTVTFGRSAEAAPPSGPLAVPIVEATATQREPSAPDQRGPDRRWLVLVGLLAVLAGAGVVSIIAWRQARRTAPPVSPTAVLAPPAPVAPRPPASAAPPAVTPIVTQLPVPGRPKRPRRVVAVAPPPSAPSRSPEAIQAKYQRVRGEYATFKNHYGGVLEERWNAIASEITFGKSDKYEHVDQMLDGLRREMQRVRDGR